jgi:hypothetical protein
LSKKGIFSRQSFLFGLKNIKKGVVLVDLRCRRFAFRGALAEPPRRKRLRGLPQCHQLLLYSSLKLYLLTKTNGHILKKAIEALVWDDLINWVAS